MQGTPGNDGYDPSAPKGGSISQLFCGNCCRRDTKAGEFLLPSKTPIKYAKAENGTNHDNITIAGMLPPAASRENMPKAPEIDTRLPPKVVTPSGEYGKHEDSSEYDEESEEEEGEDSEEEPENPGPPDKNQHRKSIENLKKSWEPLKKQMDSNPHPKFIGTRQQNWTQVIQEESDEDAEAAPAPSPEERKREIEKLKASWDPVSHRITSHDVKRNAGAVSVQVKGFAPPPRQDASGKGATVSDRVQLKSNEDDPPDVHKYKSMEAEPSWRRHKEAANRAKTAANLNFTDPEGSAKFGPQASLTSTDDIKTKKKKGFFKKGKCTVM